MVNLWRPAPGTKKCWYGACRPSAAVKVHLFIFALCSDHFPHRVLSYSFPISFLIGGQNASPSFADLVHIGCCYWAGTVNGVSAQSLYAVGGGAQSGVSK